MVAFSFLHSQPLAVDLKAGSFFERKMEEKPSTKDRLKSIVNEFDHFDSEMKMGTRVSGLSDLVFRSFLIFNPDSNGEKKKSFESQS